MNALTSIALCVHHKTYNGYVSSSSYEVPVEVERQVEESHFLTTEQVKKYIAGRDRPIKDITRIYTYEDGVCLWDEETEHLENFWRSHRRVKEEKFVILNLKIAYDRIARAVGELEKYDVLKHEATQLKIAQEEIAIAVSYYPESYTPQPKGEE